MTTYNHVVNGVTVVEDLEVNSAYVKKLTSCGTPELLNLTLYGLVEYVAPEQVTAPKTNAEIDRMREDRFRLEADPMYLAEVEYALIDNREPDFTAWRAKKDQIRAELPYNAI